MLQVERRSEFITYLFDLVGYTSNTISGKKTRLEPGQHKIYCRISFFTIPKLKYIGNKFSDTAIHHDLSHILSTSGIIISSLKHKTINTPEGERMKLIIDFEKVFTLQKLNDHWDKQKGWFSKPKENPLELMEIDFNTACQTAISQTYGVENKLQISYPIYSIATRSE